MTHQPSESLYAERRGIPWGYWFLVVFTIAGYAYLVVNDRQNGGEGNYVAAAFGLLAFIALLTLVLFGPWGPALKHVRVTSEGVWVRRRCLPADQIGKVWALDVAGAAKAHFSPRIDGLNVLRGVCSYSWFAGAGDAVYVEQRLPDGGRRAWLVGTRHPVDLARAARAVREAAGGPAHHPDDRVPAGAGMAGQEGDSADPRQ